MAAVQNQNSLSSLTPFIRPLTAVVLLAAVTGIALSIIGLTTSLNGPFHSIVQLGATANGCILGLSISFFVLGVGGMLYSNKTTLTPDTKAPQKSTLLKVVRHPETQLPFFALLIQDLPLLDKVAATLRDKTHKLEVLEAGSRKESERKVSADYGVPSGLIIFIKKYEEGDQLHYENHHAGCTIYEAFQSIKTVCQHYNLNLDIDQSSFALLKDNLLVLQPQPAYSDIDTLLTNASLG